MLNTRTRSTAFDRMSTLNRAFDQAFGLGFANDVRVWVPALDVVEKKDSYLVYAELPGVDVSDVDISFEQNVLTLHGTKKPAIDTAKDGEIRIHAAERVTGSFERSVRLPEFVDSEKISAEFVNGLLKVTVPKAQAAQLRKIEIKAQPAPSAEIASEN